jgi:2-amino-4-hydroxy-6-hydroxymethyldihydropteridine diphosphokinase
VSIGGNIGDTKKLFDRLFHRIGRDRNLRIIETSPILRNPPFGYLEQDDFFNAVILLETTIFPKSFLRRVFYLEKRFGRERTFRNAPRTLDIDIIFFDDFKIISKDLTVPHKEWQKRESVLIPLLNLGEAR